MSDLVPTLFFGFLLVEGKETLHQMFVDQMGKAEWKPVPMVDLDSPKAAAEIRKPSMAGYIPDEEEE